MQSMTALEVQEVGLEALQADKEAALELTCKATRSWRGESASGLAGVVPGQGVT